MSAANIEEAIRAIIIANSTVAAITPRCFYLGTIPQKPEYPFTASGKATGGRDHHLRGASGVAYPRFQIEAWAETYTAAKALANAVRKALDGYSGTVGTVDVRSILILSERDFYEEAVKAHRIIMDFSVRHIE